MMRQGGGPSGGKAVCIKNLACQLTGMAKDYELYFMLNGHRTVDEAARSDFVVIVGCAFSQAKMEFATRYIEQIRSKIAPDARIVLLGCLPRIESERMSSDGRLIIAKDDAELDAIFSTKYKIADVGGCNLSEDAYRDPFLKLQNSDEFHTYYWPLYRLAFAKNGLASWSGHAALSLVRQCQRLCGLLREPGKKEYVIVAQSGCGRACAYCAIRRGLGPLKSKPVDMILAEFDRGLSRGHRRFKLRCSDIGQYGADNGDSPLQLLRALLAHEGDYTVGIRHVHPQWLLENLEEIRALVSGGRISFLSVPIQSGSQRVLRFMNRDYDISRLTEALRSLPARPGRFWLTTDVIVGFPSETDEDFQMTLGALDAVGFAQVNCYPYSDRPGTRSAGYPGKIAPEVIARRMSVLKKKFFLSRLRRTMKELLRPLRFSAAPSS